LFVFYWLLFVLDFGLDVFKLACVDLFDGIGFSLIGGLS